jgi:hypothetical protein
MDIYDSKQRISAESGIPATRAHRHSLRTWQDVVMAKKFCTRYYSFSSDGSPHSSPDLVRYLQNWVSSQMSWLCRSTFCTVNWPNFMVISCRKEGSAASSLWFSLSHTRFNERKFSRLHPRSSQDLVRSIQILWSSTITSVRISIEIPLQPKSTTFHIDCSWMMNQYFLSQRDIPFR